VAASLLAAAGRLPLLLVVAVAAAAAIAGDNLGYLLGRHGARRLLTRPGRWGSGRARLLARGEALFARHGGKAVFLGRWLPGARVTVAWAAGANLFAWRRFVAWNALGGIAWAVSVAVAVRLLGGAAARDLRQAGLLAVALAVSAAVAAVLVRRRRRRLAAALLRPGRRLPSA
jgi:membrane-associated protein